MLKKIIHQLLVKQHYWRTVGFMELAELYANRLLRQMAVNMTSGIIGIYMYQIGYHLWQVAAIFSAYFFMKSVSAFASAYIIGRIGPKHASLISNFIYIPSLLAMSQLQHLGGVALTIYLLAQPFAVTLWTVSYHVGFSKVKHTEHAGKELGFMYMGEKIGTALSPIIGGFVAYWFSPSIAMFVAVIMFVISAGPLFFSPESVITRQHITFRGINWRKIWRGPLSAVSVGVDAAFSGALWSLYAALAVFGTTSNVVYAKLGGLLSIAFVASLVFSRVYGLVIDKRRGQELLRWSVVGDGALNLARIFITTPLSVVLVNVANEAFTTGYAMPYLKGQYDMADDLPGYRIVYMTLIEVAIGIGASLTMLSIVPLSYYFGDVRGLQIGYFIAAFTVLPIMAHGFPALRRAHG